MLLEYRPISGRGGRAVDRAGLENRKAERPREFESHPLRHLNLDLQKQEMHTTRAHKVPRIGRADHIGQILGVDVHP